VEVFENPNACVCGCWKREADSFCFKCNKRLAEMREQKIQQQTDRGTVFRQDGSAWDVPRIVERIVPMPQLSRLRANHGKYDNDGENMFDDIVRLYEDNQ